jgi:peptide/nickel transport system substrate-binding protein
MSKKKILSYMLLALISSSCMRFCSKPQNEKFITVDISSPVESLDSRYATSAAASRIARLIYGSLFDMGDDGPYPFLAKSVTTIDDKTFLITLRENLTFHDGSPLTAEDVVYTYQDIGTPDVASPHAEKFDYVKSITAKGPLEILFELKETHAPFLNDLCALGIVSKKPAPAGLSNAVTKISALDLIK